QPHAHHLLPHSSPTRRSSDLPVPNALGWSSSVPATSARRTPSALPSWATRSSASTWTSRRSRSSPPVTSRSTSPAWTICCAATRSEEHTSELQSLTNLVCRLL